MEDKGNSKSNLIQMSSIITKELCFVVVLTKITKHLLRSILYFR